MVHLQWLIGVQLNYGSCFATCQKLFWMSFSRQWVLTIRQGRFRIRSSRLAGADSLREAPGPAPRAHPALQEVECRYHPPRVHAPRRHGLLSAARTASARARRLPGAITQRGHSGPRPETINALDSPQSCGARRCLVRKINGTELENQRRSAGKVFRCHSITRPEGHRFRVATLRGRSAGRVPKDRRPNREHP